MAITILFVAVLLAILASSIQQPISRTATSTKLNSSSSDLVAHQQQTHLCVLENERSAIYLSMPENMPRGTILTSLPVGGVSSGQKANIRLSLVQGREFVRLNPLSKQLVLKKAVDREQGLSRIEAVIQCSPLPTENQQLPADGYFPLNISVFITITDANDNPPKFPKGGQFSINLPEELPPGTPIRLEFAASDRDQPGPNSQIRYRIVQTPNSSDSSSSSEEEFSSLLAIPDPFRAELFVAGRIDFEQLPRFSVLIEAVDQGTPPLRAVAKLEVTVMDVDDQNPVFSSPLYTAREAVGSQLVVEPGPIRAWDADSTFNETILYSLTGEHSLHYAIDELTGAVRLLADHLIPTKLVIRASQLNRPERNATALLLVEGDKVANAGDERERHQQHILLKMPADLALGTKVLQLESLANGTSRSEKYELIGQQNHFLFIDPVSRGMEVARKLSPGEYEVGILARPTLHGRSSAAHKIHLRLIIFEPAEWAQQLPVFEQHSYEFVVDWASLTRPAEGEENEGSAAAEFIPIGQIRVKNSVEGQSSAADDRHSSSKAAAEHDEDGQGGIDVEQSEQQRGLAFSLLTNGDDHFDIGASSGILRLRNPRLWQPLLANSSEGTKLQANVKLLVMAEDAEGRRNFVECTVRLDNLLAESTADEEEATFQWSPTHLLAALCFLLLLSNCATLSMWLGKRQLASLYDNLSTSKFDSMEWKGRHDFAGKESGNWMLNRSLEGDSGVKITRTVPRELFSISSFIPAEKVENCCGSNLTYGTTKKG